MPQYWINRQLKTQLTDEEKIDNKDQRLNCGIALRPNIMTLPRPSFVWIFIGLLCFVLNLEKRKVSARNFPFQRFNWIYLGILEQQLQRSSLIYITEIDHHSYAIVLLQLKRLCKVTTNVKTFNLPLSMVFLVPGEHSNHFYGFCD